jgi:hypothetical protein
MGVPTLEVGYTSATTGRGGHEVHKGHVVALEEKKFIKLWNHLPAEALATFPCRSHKSISKKRMRKLIVSEVT